MRWQAQTKPGMVSWIWVSLAHSSQVSLWPNEINKAESKFPIKQNNLFSQKVVLVADWGCDNGQSAGNI